MIAILGAGPHGRQIAHLLASSYLYDDELKGYDGVVIGAQRHRWLAGAAWPATRRRIVARVEADETTVTAHHEGRFVFPGARVGMDTDIGAHVHIGFNAVVSHGTTLGAFTTVCPGAVIAGEAVIGEDVIVGANATVLHGGIRIGIGARIGAGAVVVGDVPAYATVVGVPARVSPP